MNEPKLPKGKAREDLHWSLGWWELLVLADGPRRPVVWTTSSVIYSPHPTMPAILARHFPSSKTFSIQLEWISHTPFVETHRTHRPPTVISVSPLEDWLYAFFPGNTRGISCLWKRGQQIDSWTLHHQVDCAADAGIVTAAWTFPERPWSIGEQGAPFKLPPKGPVTPMNAPILSLVTQAHQLHVWLLPPYVPAVRIMKAPLQEPSTSNMPLYQGNPEMSDTPADPRGGRRVCTHAAIGFNYNESSLVVATRSKLLPPEEPGQLSFSANIDLGIPLGVPLESSNACLEWDQWEEEAVIGMCAIGILCRGAIAVLHTRPLASIPTAKERLIDLCMFSVPPEIVPPSPTITRDPRRAPKDSGVSEKGSLYLTATFLDFEQYSSLPKSTLVLYSATSRTANGHDISWRPEYTRIFDSAVLAFVTPAASRKGIVAGFLDPAGTISSQNGKYKDTRIGSTNVLNLPDLTSDAQWESSPLVSVSEGTGRDIPVSAVVSPSRMFVCTASFSPANGVRPSIHPAPRRISPSQSAPGSSPPRSDYARGLIAAIYSRRSPSDVVHALSQSVVPLDTVVSVLSETAQTLELNSHGLQIGWTEDLLGVLTEVYLARSKTEASDDGKKALLQQWQTAHELCSIIALNCAFEDCRDGEDYDLEAVWQLVGVCQWLVGLLERLMKQCIYIGEYDIPASTSMPLNEAYDVEIDAASSILLHILHPFALRNLQEAVEHVNRFRKELIPLSPKGENSQIAKETLIDTVNSCGVNLEELIKVLGEIKATLKIPADDLRKILVTCRLAPSLQSLLRETTDKILKSGVIDRPKLFIKSSELIDGVTRLSISDKLKHRESDVVSKALLEQGSGRGVICVRCGGASEIGENGVAIGPSLRWRVWEQSWASRCICGGIWMKRK